MRYFDITLDSYYEIKSETSHLLIASHMVPYKTNIVTIMFSLSSVLHLVCCHAWGYKTCHLRQRTRDVSHPGVDIDVMTYEWPVFCAVCYPAKHSVQLTIWIIIWNVETSWSSYDVFMCRTSWKYWITRCSRLCRSAGHYWCNWSTRLWPAWTKRTNWKSRESRWIWSNRQHRVDRKYWRYWAIRLRTTGFVQLVQLSLVHMTVVTNC